MWQFLNPFRGKNFVFIYMLLYIHIRRLNPNISVDFAAKDRLCTILYLSFLLGSVPVTPNLLSYLNSLFHIIFKHLFRIQESILVGFRSSDPGAKRGYTICLDQIVANTLNSFKYLFFWSFLPENKDDWKTNTLEAIHNKITSGN